MSDVTELDPMFHPDTETEREPAQQRGRLKTLLTIIAIIGIIAGSYWVYAQTAGKPDLVRQVESAGFTSITYYQGDTEVTASATAMYGGCTVRFINTTQVVGDNSRVARLALVRDDGSFIYDPTPTTLSLNKAYSGCGE